MSRLEELQREWEQHKKTCWSCGSQYRNQPPPCRVGIDLLGPLIDAQRDRPTVKPHADEWEYSCPHCKQLIFTRDDRMWWRAGDFVEVTSDEKHVNLSHLDIDCSRCKRPVRLEAPWAR